MFISFEGIDFSGKTTQCRRIETWLRESARDVLVVREPGGTEVSEGVRSILLDTRHAKMHPVTEMFLFSAARSQLVHEQINPSLDRGAFVLADRFHDSTTAYQGFGRGLDVGSIIAVHRLATRGTIPDLTFYLDVPYDESLHRRAIAERPMDRMEQSSRDFYEAVQEGYLSIARAESNRFHVIDGTRHVDLITEELMTMIKQHPSF